MDAVQHCTFSARLDCRYLLRVPETVDSKALLILTLHGFGADPESMLNLTAKLVGPRHVIASLEGPNQFFRDGKTNEVGYGWITSRNAPSSIRLHHEMVQHVLNEAGREYGIPPERRFLVGFSQPVSLNYRFVATCTQAVRGVIGICGGLPSDWETAPYQSVGAAVLHIARRADEFYPPEVTEHYEQRLRIRAKDVEFHLLEGGHRIPSEGGRIVQRWFEKMLS